MDKYFYIREVAQITELSPSNIRYYESEVLIHSVDRDVNGIRRFNEKEFEWIQFLGKMKELEMPIVQIKQYAILRAQGVSTIKERMNILALHKQYVLQKISKLQENSHLLDNKIEIYRQMEEKENGK